MFYYSNSKSQLQEWLKLKAFQLPWCLKLPLLLLRHFDRSRDMWSLDHRLYPRCFQCSALSALNLCSSFRKTNRTSISGYLGEFSVVLFTAHPVNKIFLIRESIRSNWPCFTLKIILSFHNRFITKLKTFDFKQAFLLPLVLTHTSKLVPSLHKPYTQNVSADLAGNSIVLPEINTESIDP